MKNLENYTDSFITLLDLFIHECNHLESTGLWNYEVFGEMESYYTNDFVGIILRLIAADGSISEKEAKYISKAFGLNLTADDLREIHKLCIDNVEESFEENFTSGLERLNGIDGNVAKLYRELVFRICEIVTESDGMVSPTESEFAEKIKAMCR